MKKYLLLLLFSVHLMNAHAQNIGINATGALPHASAMLDISASNKGILIPRTSTASRTAIVNPAKGLLLYDTTSSSFWYHNGSSWVEIAGGGTVGASAFWNQAGNNIFNTNTGNIGIGTNAPQAALHVKQDNEALRVEGNSPFIGFYNNNGTALKGFIQNVNDSFYLGTPTGNANGLLQFYVNNSPKMTILPSGNTGIGTTTPADKLTVETAGYGLTHSFKDASISTWIGNFGGITTAKIGTKSNHPLGLFANNGDPALYISTNGKVGIGTMFPANPLHVLTASNSYGIAHQSTDGALLATYIGGTSAGIGTFTNTNMRIFCGSQSAMFIAAGTNNVGIGVDFPSNKLQVGSVGASGFATNDFAIGNGTNAMAIYQTNASTLIGATTDIVLKPRNNGKGFVGINTDNPKAPLDVDGEGVLNGYYAYMNGTADLTGVLLCKFCDAQVSIISKYGVYASEFDAYSDLRIKDVEGISDGVKDLATVSALHITDYTMKDKIKYGNRPFKKVIAQEVEKVYPQAVSKHTDFIPNVYQLTSNIEQTANGWLLTFKNVHHISSNAKKLRVLLGETESMKETAILSIPADNQVEIAAAAIKTGKIFVYGEQVDDFRTVDYEALTTLGISATQEINKQVENQAVTISIQQKQIALLEKRLLALEQQTQKKLSFKAN